MSRRHNHLRLRIRHPYLVGDPLREVEAKHRPRAIYRVGKFLKSIDVKDDLRPIRLIGYQQAAALFGQFVQFFERHAYSPSPSNAA